MLEKLVAKYEGELIELRKSIDRSSTTQLRADLDTLAGMLEAHRTAVRRELGRLHYRNRGTSPDPVANGDTEQDIPSDDEFSAMLALQNAHTRN